MKKFLKLLCVAIAGIFVLPISACGQRITDGGEDVDPTRTQLYVGIYDGGYGNDWFPIIKEAFEKGHPEIQVLPSYGKEEFMWGNLSARIGVDRNEDIFIADSVNAYEAINSGKLLDISEVANMQEDGTSVAQKMLPELRDMYHRDGTYYMLPYTTTMYNIVYDVDLWDELHLWLNEDGLYEYEVLAQGGTFVKSLGQDGVADTYDDGLPITYSQFFDVVETLKRFSCVPFTWSGDYWDTYYYSLMQTMKAYFETEEEFQANFSPKLDEEGVQVKLIDFDKLNALNADGSVHSYGHFNEKPLEAISSVKTVSWDNIEELQMQAGVYYAYCFSQDLLNQSNGLNFTKVSVSPGDSHMDAQERFLRSVVEPSVTDGRIAMLIDGDWWQTEADWVFEDMSKGGNTQYSAENRRFGVMPLPLPDDREDTASPKYQSNGYQLCLFVNKNTDIPDIAIDYLKFLYSKEGIQIFSAYGYYPPFDYNLDFVNEEATYYRKQINELFLNGAKVRFRVPQSTRCKWNAQTFNYGWNFNISGNVNPARYFFNDTSKTAEDAFEANYLYYKNTISSSWVR